MDRKYEYSIAHNEHGIICIPVSSAYTYTSKAILSGKVHEPQTIKFIVENHRGMDIVHSGAGFGDFLPALSKGCSGTIWSFEPNNENYFCAQKTIELNGLTNVALRNVGLGEATTKACLRVADNGLALGPRSEICDRASGADAQECRLVRLDDLFPQPNISVIHLDTEGYEFKVLNGARKIIEKCRPIIILEIDDRAIKYNLYMKDIGYAPAAQLIYDAGEVVFVNTVYSHVSDSPASDRA